MGGSCRSNLLGFTQARNRPARVVWDACIPSLAPLRFTLLFPGCGSVQVQRPWVFKELLREALQGSCFLGGAVADSEWVIQG